MQGCLRREGSCPQAGPLPQGWGGRERLSRGQASSGGALPSVSLKEAQIRDVAPTVGEGTEDPPRPPQTERSSSKGRTAKGGLGRDPGSHQSRGPSSLAGRVPCRPALLRTCSAASGSRCGSSSGTVNWIFRGLLSCSMAGAAAAGPALRREGRRRDSGLGRARSLSAPLRPRPQPGALGCRLPAQRSQLAAPGTLPPPIGSAPAPPGPLPLPQPGTLTPSWLHRRLRGSPPRGPPSPGVAREPS